MKTSEAKILLQKYFEAETSLEEEQLLAGYFRQNDLAEEMKPYKKWFAGIEGIRQVQETGSIEEQAIRTIQEQEATPEIRRYDFRIFISGIAACLIIMAGSMLFYFQRPSYHDTFDDPAQAVAYAEKTLEFVSSKYNKGIAQLAPVHQLNKSAQTVNKNFTAINKGIKEIRKIQLVNKLKKGN